MLPFEFIVLVAPVSQQAHRRSRRKVAWENAIRTAADQHWPADSPPIENDVCVTITHFFEGAPADVDNIAKPILDAIKRLVFADDRQVTDLVAQRGPLQGPFSADPASSVLTDAIALKREFVYVRVTAAPLDGELRFL